MFESRRGTFPSTSLARVLNARKRIQRERESKRRLIERETHDKDSSAMNDEFFESNQHRPEGRGFSIKKRKKKRDSKVEMQSYGIENHCPFAIVQN